MKRILEQQVTNRIEQPESLVAVVWSFACANLRIPPFPATPRERLGIAVTRGYARDELLKFVKFQVMDLTPEIEFKCYFALCF